MTRSDVRDGQRPASEIQQSPRRGRRLEAWGWFALVLGSVLVASGLWEAVHDYYLTDLPLPVENLPIQPVSWPMGWVLAFPATVVGIGLVLFGSWAVSRGRRHLHRVLPDLRSVPEGDRVVLFLRSFSADSGFARTQASRLGRWMMWPLPVTPADMRTEEEQVARGVAPFGRMVALGRPSERLPPTGAQRSYASDAEWQDEVLAGLERAKLVLLVAGAGEGLRWEVEQAVRRDEPARLVVAITRDRRRYAEFRETVGDVFPKGLPEEPRKRSSRVRSMRAVVWFEEDWTPHLEVLTGNFPLLRPNARTQRALPRALRPVYERAGLRFPSRDASSRPRPREVPAGVALFTTAVFGTQALLIVCVDYLVPRMDGESSSGLGDDVGSAGVFGLLSVDISAIGIGLVFLVLYVVLALRVSRGGPIAVLMMQLLCLPLGFSLLMGGFILALFSVVVFSGSGFDGATLLTMLLGLNLLVLAVAVPITVWSFLFRREVREWIDSRT